MTASEGGWKLGGEGEQGKEEEEGRLPAVIDSFQYLRFAARHVISYADLPADSGPALSSAPSAHYLGTFSEVRSAATGTHRLTLGGHGEDGWRISVAGG